MSNEILLYQSNELTERIEVRLAEDTVWLSQQQMATLFQQTKQNISLHINNCFREKELDKTSTVKEYLTVQKEGNRNVRILLLTKNISRQLQLDVQKANAQYGNFEIKTFTQSHDRFIIIDNTEVYHLGASLKDLGKKWFAFAKMDKHSVESILNAITKKQIR